MSRWNRMGADGIVRRFFAASFVSGFVVTAALGFPVPARAQILLKPSGGSASPLRAKSFAARAVIRGRFAETHLDLTFLNTVGGRIEADFLYAVPPGAVVTGFAYYFGAERVVARVAEKERAAAIYRHITSRMRDPALIEMVGKRTFRARIFPVMPNADLRVEINLVSVTASEGKRDTYTLALPLDAETRNALESVRIDVRAVPDPGAARVENNFGLPFERDGDVWRLSFSGTNYRPAKNLRVSFTRPSQALFAGLRAARSGGRDGFFAMALTPPVAVSDPIVSIRGIRVYETAFLDPPAPDRDKSSPVSPGRGRAARKRIHLPAGGTLVLTGRYRGSGPAMAVLTGRGPSGRIRLSAPVAFPGAVEENHPGAKLWASARIAALSERDSNRTRVVVLSRRHGIPSKWTSWIAIPAEERERYHREKARAEAEVVARRYADLILSGRTGSPEARQARKRLATTAAAAGMSVREALGMILDQEIRESADRIAELTMTGRNSTERRRLLRRLDRICRALGENRDPHLRQAMATRYRDRANASARKLASEIAEGRESGAEAAALRRRLDSIRRIAGIDTRGRVNWILSDLLRSAAVDLVRSRRRENRAEEAALRIAGLESRVRRLEAVLGATPGNAVRQAESHVAMIDIYAARDALTREYREGRPDGAEAERLRETIRLRAPVAARSGEGDPDEIARRNMEDAAGWAIYEFAERYEKAVAEGRSESPEAREIIDQYRRLNRRIGRDPEEELRKRLLAGPIYSDHLWRLWRETDAANPNESNIAGIETVMERIERAAGAPPGYRAAKLNAFVGEGGIRDEEIETRRRLLRALRSPDPPRETVRELSDRLTGLAAERRNKSYARDRTERLLLEAELDRLEKLPPDPAANRRREEVERRVKEIRARMGDPLLVVDAPADARRVVAVMPDGAILPLEFDAASGKWRARFDIPTRAREGEHVVTVLIVESDGSRRSVTVRFRVDVTPPAGRGSAAADGDERIRIDLDASADTARVTAFLPGAEPVNLRAVPEPGRPGRFFGLLPAHPGGPAAPVRIVITDRAHNRTVVEIDVERGDTGRIGDREDGR